MKHKFAYKTFLTLLAYYWYFLLVALIDIQSYMKKIIYFSLHTSHRSTVYILRINLNLMLLIFFMYSFVFCKLTIF